LLGAAQSVTGSSFLLVVDSSRILVDCGFCQEREFKSRKRKRHEREERRGPYLEVPLYTEEDVERVFLLSESAEYEKPVNISRRPSVSFHDAGHILGSSMIKVKMSVPKYRDEVSF